MVGTFGGFLQITQFFFEIRDTRSGDVASIVLKESSCKYLMSDKYSGYGKAVREANEHREKNGIHSIVSIYCNAHSRRYFIKSENNFRDKVRFFIWCYQKIYHIRERSEGGSGFEAETKAELGEYLHEGNGKRGVGLT